MKMSELDDPSHTFIIAEAGSNWKIGEIDDNWKMIEKLVKAAAIADADAIKFQTFNSKSLYVPNAGQIKYLKESGEKNQINKVIEELELPHEMLKSIHEICEKNNIIFMSSAFSVDDAVKVDEISTIHKVASYEINHIKLLEFLAKTKKPILLSTGASTYDEIDFAVKFLQERSHYEIALLQCTSKYPTPLESLNLSVIPKLKTRYGLPVGFSDHSLDPIIAPLTAIGFGATIIEKHFTIDKSLSGPDHAFAIEPDELKLMVKAIRKADSTKGSGEKVILDIEKELRQFATRAIQATKNIQKGEILKIGVNFDILRPGNRKRGAEPRFLQEIQGKKAINEISEGDGILLSDCIN